MSDAQNVGAVPYEIYRAQRANEARIEAASLQMDVAPPGGIYREGDRWVDANGKTVEGPQPTEPAAPKDDAPEDEGAYKGKSAAEMKALAEQRGLDPGTTRKSALAALLAADAASPAVEPVATDVASPPV